MTTISYEFELNKHVGFPPPSVAAAVDLNANDVADPGESITLSQTGLLWEGERDLNQDASGLVVMTLFQATMNAQYRITIKDENGNKLAEVNAVVHQQPQVQFLVLK